MNNQQPRQSRATTYFKFLVEEWLYGIVRSKLTSAERGVLADFYSLAALHSGTVPCPTRGQIAGQFHISKKLLNQCIEKFIRYDLAIRYHKEDYGELFYVANWERVQADYMKKKEKKWEVEEGWVRCEKDIKPDADILPTLDNTKLDNTKEYKSISDNIKLDNTREDDANGDNGLSPHSTRTNTKGNNFNEREESCASLEVGTDTLLGEALSILYGNPNYPIDGENDKKLLTQEIAKWPDVDPVEAVRLAVSRVMELPNPESPFVDDHAYILEAFAELSSRQ